ncbi:MAG TPA: helix-turn-helix domain-containing protein [Polyangiaceae bacterium]|jgi:DNA-binding transcriptional regulator YiaG|nr:helix-turn-helix domain-containing protein [Polyangiaceae bacterium]
MPKHITKVGRWTVEDAGTVVGSVRTTSDGTEALSSEQLESLELRAAITVLASVELVTGAELKFARKAMGLKQVDLAEHLGVNAETVSRWETDADNFKRTVQLAVLRLLEEYQRTGSIARPIRSPRASDRVLLANRS